MKYLSKSNLVRLIGAVSLAALMVIAGCGSISSYTLATDFNSTPVKSQTKLTRALKCFGSQLAGVPSRAAYAFMVRDIVDGTVNKEYADGPLSDAGRIQMISILSAHTKPSYAVVTDEFPLMLRPTVNEQVGLNRFAIPSNTNLQSFVGMLTQVSNTDRKSRGLAAVQSVVPLIIDGAFTRYDSSHIRSKGYGSNAGYRGDADDEESLSIDRGKSGSERSVTLVVNIIDPKTNVVVGTEAFDLKFYSDSKTARFRVAIDDYYYGFSNTNVRVETIHAAQQTLLEAGAIWILDNAFGRQVDFSPCFDNEKTLALGQDARTKQAVAPRHVAQDPYLGGLPATITAPATIVPTVNNVGSQATTQPLQRVVRVAPAKVPAESPITQSGWQVRVGAFVQSHNIRALSNLLSDQGYSTRATSVKVDAVNATRIWLGPYASKRIAEEVRDKMAKLTGEESYIFLKK